MNILNNFTPLLAARLFQNIAAPMAAGYFLTGGFTYAHEWLGHAASTKLLYSTAKVKITINGLVAGDTHVTFQNDRARLSLCGRIVTLNNRNLVRDLTIMAGVATEIVVALALELLIASPKKYALLLPNFYYTSKCALRSLDFKQTKPNDFIQLRDRNIILWFLMTSTTLVSRCFNAYRLG